MKMTIENPLFYVTKNMSNYILFLFDIRVNLFDLFEKKFDFLDDFIILFSDIIHVLIYFHYPKFKRNFYIINYFF